MASGKKKGHARTIAGNYWWERVSDLVPRCVGYCTLVVHYICSRCQSLGPQVFGLENPPVPAGSVGHTLCMYIDLFVVASPSMLTARIALQVSPPPPSVLSCVAHAMLDAACYFVTLYVCFWRD